MDHDIFLTFDPYLSFADGEKGVANKAFYKVDGSPSYDDSWTQRPTPSFWRMGRLSYSIVSKKLGYQPRKDDFKRILDEVRALERDFIPKCQFLIDNRGLCIKDDTDAGPVKDLAAHIVDAPDGWVFDIYMRFALATITAGTGLNIVWPNFELGLAALAVIYVDACIISEQLDSGLDLALDLVQSNLAGADLFRKALEATEAKAKMNAKKGGAKRHESTEKIRSNVINEWGRDKHEYESRADFVRIRHSHFGVKPRTMDTWIADFEKFAKK